MILIYSPKITPRIRYIFDHIFDNILGVRPRYTSNIEEYSNSATPKINYSYHPILKDELFFESAPLLFEQGLNEQDLNIFKWENSIAFFETGKLSAMAFDPFASSFFLLSRYEEYMPHKRDIFDRYEATESLAYQHNFLHKPVVDQWIQRIQQIIKLFFPSLTFKNSHYNFISTIDIDHAYAYLEKGITRNMAGYFKSLLELNLNEMSERFKVIAGIEKDPFDTYDKQLEIQCKYNIPLIYFFLVGDYDLHDKSISIHNRRFQSLIKSIADHAGIGLHPSYASNKNPEKIKMELQRLNQVLHRDINISRQHFLKLKLPETYRNLSEYEIREDYSMGYASDIGFRAGTSNAFYFYDIEKEKETNLKIHPFAVMDSTLKYYMRVQPSKVMDIVVPIINEIKKVNGTFILLWHNEAFSGKLHWQGWENLYEDIVKEAIND
jgi:hypothetical protein